MKKNKLKRKVKIAIITGASSGIGKACGVYLSNKGYNVYGLARRQFNIQGVTSIQCDVTDKLQVKEAVEQIMNKEGIIDLLVNNAGFGISGSVENQTMEEIESIFKVNFFGAVNVTQQVLPFMRKQGSGKIVNISSVASIFPIPFQSFYCATKASLDVWAKALRMEVKPFNIQVCNLLVGDTKTNFTGVRQKNKNDQGSVYEDVVNSSVAKMERDEQKGKDPVTVAKVLFKVAQKKRLPASKTVGFSYKFLVFLEKILPQKLMLWVVSKLYT